MSITKKQLKEIEIKSYSTGFSFWYKGRWILDASNFRSDGHVALNTNPNLGLVFKLIKLDGDKIELQVSTP